MFHGDVLTREMDRTIYHIYFAHAIYVDNRNSDMRGKFSNHPLKQIHAPTLQAAVKLLDGINPKEALSKPSGHLERMTFQKPTKETDVSTGGGRAKGGGRRKRGDGETPAPPKNKETLVKFVSYFACVRPTSLCKIKSST